MKVLIAEDDTVSRRLLQATLERADYDVIATEDGVKAWEVLRQPDAPRLLVLDWMMPRMDGVQLCHKIREQKEFGYVYVVMLTARGQKGDVIAGLQAGADDYLTKPFDPQELRTRLEVGERILNLQSALEEKVDQLQELLGHVKQLQGLLPICMYCKKIRDDDATWHRLEGYIQEHSEALFTHSMCDDCADQHHPAEEVTAPRTDVVR